MVVGGQQTIALVNADLSLAMPSRTAQRDLDTLRQRGKIGLAVERCKNGAADESSAAQRGEIAGKPRTETPWRSTKTLVPLSTTAAALAELIASAASIDMRRATVFGPARRPLKSDPVTLNQCRSNILLCA